MALLCDLFRCLIRFAVVRSNSRRASRTGQQFSALRNNSGYIGRPRTFREGRLQYRQCSSLVDHSGNVNDSGAGEEQAIGRSVIVIFPRQFGRATRRLLSYRRVNRDCFHAYRFGKEESGIGVLPSVFCEREGAICR